MTQRRSRHLAIVLLLLVAACESGGDGSTVPAASFVPGLGFDSEGIVLGEAAPAAVLGLTLPEGLPVDLEVELMVAGSALEGSDYTLSQTSVKIPAGRIREEITLAPLEDQELEGLETVELTIASVHPPDAVQLSSQSSVAIELIDAGEMPRVYFTRTQVRATEIGGPIVLPVRLSSKAEVDVVVPLELDGSAGSSDYTLIDNPVVIRRGTRENLVVLRPTLDTSNEGSDSIRVCLGQVSGATVGSQSCANVTLRDPEPGRDWGEAVVAGAGVLESHNFGPHSFESVTDLTEDLRYEIHLSPDQTKLAYHVELEEGAYDRLFVRDEETGSEHLVSGDFVVGEYVWWSPDSSTVAFWGRPGVDQDWELFMAAADGSGTAEVVGELLCNCWEETGWSPFGSYFGFLGLDSGAETRRFFTVRKDGTELVDRSGDLGGEEVEEFTWAPDGKAALFLTREDDVGEANRRLYLVDLEEGIPRPLAGYGMWYLNHEWTRTSEALVYRRSLTPEGSQSLVYTSLDGSVVADNSLPGFDVGFWRISPDGSSVGYVADDLHSETSSIYVEPLGGGPATLIKSWRRTTYTCSSFRWSPGSDRLSYTIVDLDGPSDLFVSTVDGIQTINLTDTPPNHLTEVGTWGWSPNGDYLALVVRKWRHDLPGYLYSSFFLATCRTDGSEMQIQSGPYEYRFPWQVSYLTDYRWAMDSRTLMYHILDGEHSHQGAYLGVFRIDGTEDDKFLTANGGFRTFALRHQ